MGFESLDKTTIWILMIIGGLFSIAGLYLLTKRSLGEGTSKIEIFGVKFQSSSAGTLVFLIGAAFLIIPLIVPEKSIGTHPTVANSKSPSTRQENNKAQTKTEELSTFNQETGKLAVVLPTGAGATENEPNNHLTESNQISRGRVYAGQLDKKQKDYEDWYVVPTKDIKNQDMRVQIRGGYGDCEAVVFNELEERLERGYCNNEGGSVNIKFFCNSGEYIFIKIGLRILPPNWPVSYELMVH